MKQILIQLQQIQMDAFLKGVHSFNITARQYEDGDKGLHVSIFLRGDDSDEDYQSENIYEGEIVPEFKVQRIKAIIDNFEA